MHKLPILLLLALPCAASAASFFRPPATMVGIGNAPCSAFVSTYETMAKINRHEVQDSATLQKTYEDYGNFSGTLSGFFASFMMEHGDKVWPFKSTDYALSLAYQTCQHNPTTRYIDIVYLMAKTSFARGVKWK
ncbi:hypothetical protein [Methylovulum psychrotolerans]|uniref:Rap1a immunity protein domain-containing protein n=1 Tax=Methylovulum psychrotolerans TaxID=1704499 RepID=A0A1Z4BZG4_9GAMM|nr:hypothetical protein [Methylovulum psychrotolerans]ASF46684.1 hypothetical protein CEK71_11700 [Methylovulum psychrotolerans]POZ50918.1 hypothetical protein AADEFJLK_03390 [Methylovulum psychrotolerans]